jgi:hypothetical protein
MASCASGALRRFSCPWLGDVVPFALKDSTQFRPSPPPPHLASGEYVRDYNEVKALGRATRSARTQAQTDLAIFYSDNFIVLWQRTLRSIGGTINNVGDNARLFALSEIAAIDSIISLLEHKEVLQLLAAANRYHAGRDRRQLTHRRRSKLAAISPDATLS